MIILGEEAQVEGWFDLFGDNANLEVHGLHETYHMLRNPFRRTQIELLDNMCHMESRFGVFGDRVSFGAR
jgi:hypothetical protein